MLEEPRPNRRPDAPAPRPDDVGSPSPAAYYAAYYLDDLAAGQRFTSGSLRVDEAEIKAFAAQFDPQPFHLDEAAARESVFGGLVASGWHTASLTMRLLVQGGLPIAGGLIGAAGEIGWPRPTWPGDVLTVESEVLEVVASKSRPGRGLATVRSETRNQRGEPVQIFTMKLVVPRRPEQAKASGSEQTG